MDPGVVERWDMVDFTDREEYMIIQINQKPETDTEPEYWEGPGS